MSNNIGRLIGVVETDEFGCMASGGTSLKVKIRIDFTDASDKDIIQWLIADRKIAFRSTRNKSLDEAKYKACTGKLFAASKIGEKPVLTEAEKSRMQLDSLLKQGLIDQVTYDNAMNKLNS